MSKIEALIESIKVIYRNTTTTRFLADGYGMILWKSGRDIDENTEIYFPDGPPESGTEEQYSSVIIDGKPCCVRGTVLSYEDRGAVLWTVFSMKNIIGELGVTKSYDEMCHLVFDAKCNVERILLENEESIARDPRRRNSAPILNQNRACFSLLKQIESFDTLLTVIYKREVNNTTLNIVEILDEIAGECNEALKNKSYNIDVYSKTVDLYSALIKGNKYYFHLTLMAFVNKLLSCSKSRSHTIRLTFDGHRFIIAFTFEHDMCDYIDSLNGDFSLYCAKMYIRRLGGSVSEKDNQLFITLPRYVPKAFHSPDSEFSYDKSRFRYLTSMFLYNIGDTQENTNNKNRTVYYIK